MLETFLTPVVVTTAILDADDINARADAIISSYESFASLSTKIAALLVSYVRLLKHHFLFSVNDRHGHE